MEDSTGASDLTNTCAATGSSGTSTRRRIEDRARHWKISEGDYAERPSWDAYTEAFEEALGRCSTKHVPWFAIPSNHKWFRNLAVARIVCEALEALDMRSPEPTVDIAEIQRNYHAIVEEEEGKDTRG